MLGLLDKTHLLTSGLSVSISHGSDLFLQLHFIAKCLASKEVAVLVSSRYTEMHLRIICTKLAIRWDPNLINVLCVEDLLSPSLCPQDVCSLLLEKLFDLNPSTVVFDDCNLLERLAGCSTNVVEMLYNLIGTSSRDMMIHASFTNRSPLYNLVCVRADLCIDIETVGSGFGKEVTGKMTVTSADGLVPRVTELLYWTGDRSMKCFYPGSASIVI